MQVNILSLLTTLLQDVDVSTPGVASVSIHTGGGTVLPVPIAVHPSLNQTIQQVQVAAAPSVAAGHVTPQNLALGMLLAHLVTQAQPKVAVPPVAPAEPALVVSALVQGAPSSPPVVVQSPAFVPNPWVSAPVNPEPNDQEPGGFDGPSR